MVVLMDMTSGKRRRHTRMAKKKDYDFQRDGLPLETYIINEWGHNYTLSNSKMDRRGYVTVTGLPPLAPHTNPASDDMFSMYTVVGQSNECYIMFQDHYDTDTEYEKRDKPHMQRMVLYHTPTGTKIEIEIDLKWLNDPTFDRDRKPISEPWDKRSVRGRNPERL